MITIVLRQVNLGHSGPRYEVKLDGEVLLDSTRDPEYDGARALKERGLTGPFRTTDATGLTRMTFTSIEETAKWYIVENDEGIRLRKWTPFPVGTRKDALNQSGGIPLPENDENAS